MTGLKRIDVGDGRVRCERDAGGARDVYDVPLPAVLTVLEGLNLPRYPSVPGRLRAKSKPLAVVEPARPELEAREAAARRCRRARASRRRSSATAPAAAPTVVEVMQQLGVA